MTKEIARNYRQTGIKAFPTFTSTGAAVCVCLIVVGEEGGRLVRSAGKSTLVLNFVRSLPLPPSLPPSSVPLFLFSSPRPPLLHLLCLAFCFPPSHSSFSALFSSACHIHHVVIGRSLMTTLHRITLARKRTDVDFTLLKLCHTEYIYRATAQDSTLHCN